MACADIRKLWKLFDKETAIGELWYLVPVFKINFQVYFKKYTYQSFKKIRFSSEKSRYFTGRLTESIYPPTHYPSLVLNVDGCCLHCVRHLLRESQRSECHVQRQRKKGPGHQQRGERQDGCLLAAQKGFLPFLVPSRRTRTNPLYRKISAFFDAFPYLVT